MQFSTLLQLAMATVAANGAAISINPLDSALSSLSIPSDIPTGIPTGVPSGIPTGVPSGIPTGVPSGAPFSESGDAKLTKTGGLFGGLFKRNNNEEGPQAPTGTPPIPSGVPSGVPPIPSGAPTGNSSVIPSGIPPIPSGSPSGASV